ncbi:MAG TPA: FecR domain-containing protein [Gemmatimonadaceae bacterium]|jgi:ferric-dicitrate binding protein FerR (iron transport regulator)|nr:FecR domain-containing protein [Gemmatimonadaceae bacterium]
MDELIDRARRGETSAAELAELDAWRRASDANERQYRDTVRMLDVARSLGTESGPAIPAPTARELIEQSRSRRPPGRVAARWAPWAIAAAASIMAVVAVQSRLEKDSDSVPGWNAAEVVTGSTELATVQLGEGSVVRLAPSSRLRVLAGRGRTVSLEGRAFFAVQRMPTHPLRVTTPAGEARVLGTRFELVADGGGLRVRVVEGRVALSTPSGEVEVGAGEESGVRAGVVTRPEPLTTPAAVASWAGTFLAFQATPLRDAAREIERVYKTPVTIADSALAEQTITATFTDRPVDEVVNVVCAVLSATCELRDGRVRIDR